MYKLYGPLGGWVTNIASLVASIGVVTAQATAMGYIFHYFFQIPISCSTVICLSVLALYSAFGGIRAVAHTDVFQFIIIVLAIPASCFIVYGIEAQGGIIYWHRVFDQLSEEMLSLNLSKDNIGLFISLTFFSLLPKTGGPFIQRFLMSRNARQLTNCLKVVAAIYFPFSIIICLIGLFIKAEAPNIHPSSAFIYFVANYLCIGIKGLVITGLLAIIMSTADSFLNTTSVLITHDIVRKLTPLTEAKAYLLQGFLL